MSQRVFGIDFTSRPTAAKPITCVQTTLTGDVLRFDGIESWTSFAEFDAFLASDGPWIAGMDFPFGQARRFLENLGWPTQWSGYAERVASLSRPEWRQLLDDYRRDRPPGDKEHKRETDRITGAVSSQKLYGVPVALMFYEGVPRLWRSKVSIPLLRPSDDERIALEAYPGVLARELIGRVPYKQDVRDKQNQAQREARQRLLEALCNGEAGLTVSAPGDLVDDPKADTLDALLCAVQATKAVRSPAFGIPPDADQAEGWIAASVR
ncbi:MAG: DUF429 domain-containing protein [Pseudomonadota bacterium]